MLYAKATPRRGAGVGCGQPRRVEHRDQDLGAGWTGRELLSPCQPAMIPCFRTDAWPGRLG